MSEKPKELEEHSAKIFELGCMERPVYLKEDVDAVIAGLKQKLQDQCISCPVKMQEDYLQPDVDKILAEKDKKIAEQKERYFELQDTAIKIDKELTETRKELRHQKLKRCVAMASYWVAVSYQCVDDKHRQSADRHRRKWLELANKFKDKEAK